jgi:hypothetical protein
MQLVAYGAQDIFLTGNPQITFFKVVYRRHTNFAMESIEQTFTGAADFGKKMTCTVSRNGDLIHHVYLRVELPEVTIKGTGAFRWLNWVGHVLIRSVEIEIGGQRIDKHYGDWMHIWNELTQSAGHMLGYANMLGNIPQLVNPVENTSGSDKVVPGEILYIPLEFWFCRNPGLALPLIALQYHEVKLNLELSDKRDCYWAARPTGTNGEYEYNANAVDVPSLPSASLFVDYIFLDTEERRRFAQVSHEYLIEQLQFTGDESTSTSSNKVKLNFNHPVKELVWIVQPDDHTTDAAPYGKQWFNYTDAYDVSYSPEFAYNMSSLDLATPNEKSAGLPGIAAGGANGVFVPVSFEGGSNPVKMAKLQLNGHDRFSERDGRYFNLVQPYQHHENVPSRGINVYSFALKPEEHQPSGSANMSRIDNATLNLTLTRAATHVSTGSGTSNRTCKLRVYAVSYNVLRIMSGMGGLKIVLQALLVAFACWAEKQPATGIWVPRGQLRCTPNGAALPRGANANVSC